MKIPGLITNDKLTWDENTDYICKKAKKKIWILRGMKQSGLNKLQLVDAYQKEVRSLLELAVPVWSSGITLDQSADIKRVQKSALAAILGSEYHSYALKILGLERLSERRKTICKKFIFKNMKSDCPLLTTLSKSYQTRSGQNLVEEFGCRTQKFFSSSLPYLARLYNNEVKKQTNFMV